MLTIINSRLLTCLAGGVLLAAYLIDAKSAHFFGQPSYRKGGSGYSDNSWTQWGSNYENVGYGQVELKPRNGAGHFGFGHGSSPEDYSDDYYHPTDYGYNPYAPIPSNPEIWYPGDPFDNPHPPKPIGPVGWDPPVIDPFFPFHPSTSNTAPGNGKNDDPHAPKPIGPLGWDPPSIDPFFPFHPSTPNPGPGNEEIPPGIFLNAGNGNVVIHGGNVRAAGGNKNGKPIFSNVPVMQVTRTERPKKRVNKND